MLERTLQLVRTDAAPGEEPAATRERLKTRFAAGAVRRMTQLGMLVGSLLHEVQGEPGTLIYASEFGEGRALEAFLDSFPSASPTLFQTSIHPSGVQQGLISRQQPLREFIPMAGGAQLIPQALMTALVSPSASVVLCGGEERGTWLVPHRAASDRTFAFLAVLGPADAAEAMGRLRFVSSEEPASALHSAEWFEALHERRPLGRTVLPGWRLELVWS